MNLSCLQIEAVSNKRSRAEQHASQDFVEEIYETCLVFSMCIRIIMNKLIGWDCVWGEKERGSTSEEFINSIVCRRRLRSLFSTSLLSSGFYYSVYIPSPHQQRRDTTKQQARSISNIRALKPRESSETMMTMWRRRWAWAWALPDSDSIAEFIHRRSLRQIADYRELVCVGGRRMREALFRAMRRKW